MVMAARSPSQRASVAAGMACVGPSEHVPGLQSRLDPGSSCLGTERRNDTSEGIPFDSVRDARCPDARGPRGSRSLLGESGQFRPMSAGFGRISATPANYFGTCSTNPGGSDQIWAALFYSVRAQFDYVSHVFPELGRAFPPPGEGG